MDATQILSHSMITMAIGAYCSLARIIVVMGHH